MSFYLYALPRLDGSETDGMHLVWSPPYPAGHAINGFTIQRRDAEQDHEQVCFTISDGDLDRARRQGTVRLSDALIWATPRDRDDPGSEAWTYRCALDRRHRALSIEGSGAVAAFAGRDDGQVVDAARFVADRCDLRGPDIAIVWLVVLKPGSDFRLCGDIARDEVWAEARTLVSGLQMPFQSVDPGLGSADDELARAMDLALPEPLDGAFDDLSRYANRALSRPFERPAWKQLVNDPGAQDARWDTTSFGMVAALTAVSPAWRRGLGLGFLDQDDLTPGAIYDYRISGLVRRADRDERQYDFHTVPSGYVLPRWFRLDDLICVAVPNATIDVVEDTDGDLISLLKGLVCDRLTLFLPAPTDRLVVSGLGGTVDAEGLVSGAVVAAASATLEARTRLDFGTPVDTVVLKYDGLLTGIVPAPLPPGVDPEEPVEIAAVVHGTVFDSGPPVPPPSNLAVDNLGSAARTADQGHRQVAKGLEVSWDVPPSIDPGLLSVWPPDTRQAPPSIIAGYSIDRSVDGGPFAPLERNRRVAHTVAQRRPGNTGRNTRRQSVRRVPPCRQARHRDRLARTDNRGLRRANARLWRDGVLPRGEPRHYRSRVLARRFAPATAGEAVAPSQSDRTTARSRATGCRRR